MNRFNQFSICIFFFLISCTSQPTIDCEGEWQYAVNFAADAFDVTARNCSNYAPNYFECMDAAQGVLQSQLLDANMAYSCCVHPEDCQIEL